LESIAENNGLEVASNGLGVAAFKSDLDVAAVHCEPEKAAASAASDSAGTPIPADANAAAVAKGTARHSNLSKFV
jgi:hypothetical protein